MVARAFLFATFLTVLAFAADWPQFRGPNSSGVSDDSKIPVDFSPDRNVVWKTALPPGNSSPAIAGNRIFVTALEKDKLLTIALDRGTGRILWRREAPRPRIQEIQRPANGPVSSTPATDGRNVYSFFADFGLLAYGPDGNELWRMPLGPFNTPFGFGSSPILAGGAVLMNIDQDVGSYLLAVDKVSGRVLWRTERPHAQRGYATPILYKTPEGEDQVIVIGSYRMSGYDLKTGKEVWWIRGLPWQIKPTPVIGDGAIYFVTFSAESDPGEQEVVPPFNEALTKMDSNKDGRLSKDEIPDKRVKDRFEEYLDLDDSGYLEAHDWEQLQERRQGESGLRAYRLGGRGDLTRTNFLWKNPRSLPNVPSPLFYRGVVYTLKEGGILTSFDIKTGQIVKQARIQGAPGDYFSSPTAADGKIYTISEEGKLAVIQAGPQWELIRINDMQDGTRSTPVLLEGKIYVRTYGAVYCFADKS